MTYEFDCYQPSHYERFETLPGLSGLWQVCGKNKTTFTEMIALDIRYVRQKSLWLDLSLTVESRNTREHRGISVKPHRA